MSNTLTNQNKSLFTFQENNMKHTENSNQDKGLEADTKLSSVIIQAIHQNESGIDSTQGNNNKMKITSPEPVQITQLPTTLQQRGSVVHTTQQVQSGSEVTPVAPLPSTTVPVNMKSERHNYDLNNIIINNDEIHHDVNTNHGIEGNHSENKENKPFINISELTSSKEIENTEKKPSNCISLRSRAIFLNLLMLGGLELYLFLHSADSSLRLNPAEMITTILLHCLGVLGLMGTCLNFVPLMVSNMLVFMAWFALNIYFCIEKIGNGNSSSGQARKDSSENSFSKTLENRWLSIPYVVIASVIVGFMGFIIYLFMLINRFRNNRTKSVQQI